MVAFARHLAYTARSSARICRENGPLVTLSLLVDRVLRRKRLVRLRIHGSNVWIRTCSPDVHVALACLGKEYAVLDHAFDRDVSGLIVDAGGNIGTAAIALSRLYPQATVVTIEPSEENFQVLRRNVEGNPRIHAERAALLRDEGRGEIELLDRGSSVGFTVVPRPYDVEAKPVGLVKAISLRTLMEKYGAERIRVLKMDIEGGEQEFLSSGPAWLDRVDVLMIELHDRITPGVSDDFFRSSRNRYVYRAGGEKYVSVGRSVFDSRAAGSP